MKPTHRNDRNSAQFICKRVTVKKRRNLKPDEKEKLMIERMET